MNEEELKRLFPKASKAFLAANANSGNEKGPKSEFVVCDEPLGPPQGETFYPGRVFVRVTAYRQRLTDPDGCIAKYFLDACRYSRLIRDDGPEDIEYSLEQKKVKTKAEERTEILITPLN